jgi:hypothetical protein
MRSVWLADWMRRADRHNQQLVDALVVGFPQLAPVVIESLPQDPTPMWVATGIASASMVVLR